MPVHTPGDPRPADAAHAGRSRSAPPSLRSPPSRFHVMNAIIAYLPSGDKKVIIPSAHRYFIICPWARFGARAPATLIRSTDRRGVSELLLNDGRGGNYAIMRESKTRWDREMRRLEYLAIPCDLARMRMRFRDRGASSTKACSRTNAKIESEQISRNLDAIV